MHRYLGFLLLLPLCLISVSPALGDEDEFVKQPRALERLKFRNIGPSIGGRVCRAVGVPGDPLTYYAATASGGLWKSSDGGFRWKAVMDMMPTSTIGCIAVAPSDANVLYVGSGEANIRGNVEVGNGIYRSLDAGKTWKHVWKQEGQIGTMIVHPTDPKIAYAAVLGKAFGANPERGVYRTTDGGNTWKRILFRNEDAGAIDVRFNPDNPRILLAGLWQTRRKPWELTSGGPGSGLYFSRDGGDSWTHIVAAPEEDDGSKPAVPQGIGITAARYAKGLPKGIWGRIGLAWAPSNAKRVYALIEAEEGGLFRSDDGGESWTRINSNRAIRQRPWYFSTLTVHPRNADTVYAPQVPLLKSNDGGKTFTRIRGPHHGDHHDLWIDPKNPERMIDSNDGGVDISVDGGGSWYAPPLPICQFYHIAVDNRRPYYVAGTIQDIGTAMGPSHCLTSSGIPLSEWYGVGGGEAGHIAIDPEDHRIVYAGEYGGYISRFDYRTRQAKNIGIYPYNPSGFGGEDLKYRFQWTAPLIISPHDHNTIYHGGNVLFMTPNAGKTWSAVSKDLTRNDKSKQKWSGGPITGDNTGVEIYGTIFAVAESPKKKGLLWVGSDDGLVHVSADAGKTWDNVTDGLTKAGLPEWGTVLCIEPSTVDENRAYVVVDGHRIDDRKPYLFVTQDLGKTWQRLTVKMPEMGFLCVVREDPTNDKILYVGCEKGLIYSRDAGATWDTIRLGLPTVRVTALKVKDDDLVVGTNGRSIWILDDLTPVRAGSPAPKEPKVTLYPVRPTYRYRTTSGPRREGPMTVYDNPPSGAIIHYHLPKKSTGEITLEILDGDGKKIREYSSKKKEPKDKPDLGAYSAGDDGPPLLPTAQGLHRFIWDLHAEGAEAIANARVDAGNPRNGPLVTPGKYTARLSVEGKTQNTPIEVRLDPRQTKLISEAELKARWTTTLNVRNDITQLTRIVEKLRLIKKQLQDRNTVLEKVDKSGDLVKASKTLIEKLDQLEAKLHNPKAEVTYDILAMKGGAKLYSQLVWIYEQLKDADGAPTQGIQEVYADHAAELKKLTAQWQTLLKEDVANLNDLAKKGDKPIIVIPTPK